MIFTPAHVMQARRELARDSLADFACMIDIPTAPITSEEDEDTFSTIKLDSLAQHHALLCDDLQALAEGKIPNLMVLMPPGSAKSTYVDVVFIPWFMAKYPKRNVILGSYATKLARKQGRRARQLINSKSYRNLFPGVTLSAESSAAEEFKLSTGGEFMAGGLLSGITGNRAALGVLDDPLAGREEAESEPIREKTWDAYVDDFCSRLTPGAPQVMVLTRWHALDPAGRILPEDWNGESGWFDGRDGRRWKVICLPAIADRADDPLGREIGQGLWPEWFPMSHWEPFKRNTRTWTSLYQQKPSPEEGTYFKREWFQRWEVKPNHLHVYMTSDHAMKEGSGDYTVIRVWGVDPKGDLYLLDGHKAQETSDVWMTQAARLIKVWKPLCWFPENDNTWKAIEPFVKRFLRSQNTLCRIEALTTAGGDKAVKARGFQAMCSMGKVFLPSGLMGDQVLDEYLRFPAGKHDDEVDAAAHMGRALMDAHPAIVPVREIAHGPQDAYARARERYDNDADWMTA